MEDLCRFGEGPLSRSSGESPNGRLKGTDKEDEEQEGEAYMGEAEHWIRNGFFFFSNRGRPQPHLGHF